MISQTGPMPDTGDTQVASDYSQGKTAKHRA